jgi:hypothetical protein
VLGVRVQKEDLFPIFRYYLLAGPQHSFKIDYAAPSNCGTPTANVITVKKKKTEVKAFSRSVLEMQCNQTPTKPNPITMQAVNQAIILDSEKPSIA